jgi:DNA-binding FadR family transcriptional regulator
LLTINRNTHPLAPGGPSGSASAGLSAPRRELGTLKRLPLTSQIQEAIKSYVLENGLRPGDPLPSEGEFARQLDTGRNSVREAVKSLEVLGIIETRRGSGLFVKAFTFDAIIDNLPYGLLFDVKSIMDLIEVRAHLENGMVKRVILEVTPEQLATLDAIVEHMRAEAEQGRYSFEDDRAFHEALYVNVDNPVLSRVLAVGWLVVQRARELAHLSDPYDLHETVRSHELIRDALANRSADEMHEAFDHHYGRLKLRLPAQPGGEAGETDEAPA